MRGNAENAINIGMLQEVRKTTELLCTLPPTFGKTLSAHMKRLHITNERLAEMLCVSVRWVSGLRNAVVPTIRMPMLIAICICLQLEPELSEDLIRKAGLLFLYTEEHGLYRWILRNKYRETLDNCNQSLKEAGYHPLNSES